MERYLCTDVFKELKFYIIGMRKAMPELKGQEEKTWRNVDIIGALLKNGDKQEEETRKSLA